MANMARFVKKPCIMLAALATAAPLARATLYTDLLGSSASINSTTEDVVQNGKSYLTVFKPVPPTSNIHNPWISTNGGYTSNNSISYEIDPSPSGDTSTTDKVDTRISYGGDTTALGFDSVKFLGFALNIPAANFGAVVGDGSSGVQIAQWWQGSPYSPPLALDLTGVSNGKATFELIAHNDTTLGNPSSVPITITTGTIPFDIWNTFEIETTMDFNGNGEVALWENGTKLVDWTGAVGYDPSTIPYKNPPQGTANPNQSFDVFFGPYRPIQNTEQVEQFDDVRWANTLADATPVPQATVTLSSTSSLSVVSDGDIGGSLASTLSFSGGTLAVTSSFTSGRAITIATAGGTLDVAPGITFAVGNSLNWAGGTLGVTDSGKLSLVPTGNITVATGSTLNIGSISKVAVSGPVDPFTDSSNTNQHVAVVDNGSLTVTTINSTINSITGTGSLTVGDGTTANTVKLATNSGGSSLGSLTILGNSALDIGNNHLIINYSSGTDPIPTIAAEIANGFHGRQWNGRGIISSAAAGNPNYGVGYADSADQGNPAGLSSGTLEIKYTLLGDVDLNGVVNGIDFGIFAANFNKTVTSWDQGDFDYNGVVNGIDFGYLAANFNQAASGASALAALDAFAAANGLLADVPEPGMVAVIGLSTMALLARRRRAIA
jgi:hypothetical protein